MGRRKQKVGFLPAERGRSIEHNSPALVALTDSDYVLHFVHSRLHATSTSVDGDLGAIEDTLEGVMRQFAGLQRIHELEK